MAIGKDQALLLNLLFRKLLAVMPGIPIQAAAQLEANRITPLP